MTLGENRAPDDQPQANLKVDPLKRTRGQMTEKPSIVAPLQEPGQGFAARTPVGVPTVVLDTNAVLALAVFEDPALGILAHAVAGCAVRWLATPRMRDELVAVTQPCRLGGLRQGESQQLALAYFDTHAACVPPAPAAPLTLTCRDTDDQPFIDLAHAHRAQLLSRDKAVLALRRRATAWGWDIAPPERFALPR